jgi:nickel-dependent lactate racemase
LRITIPYGESVKTFDLPDRNLLRIITHSLPKHPTLQEEEETIGKALASPIGADSLRSLASRGVSKVVILVDDWTRPTPVFKVWPSILRELRSSGVREEAITIIVARGTHRKPTRKELEAKLGSEVLKAFKVKHHENEDGERLINLGRTRRGTPIWINREFYEADLKIAIGSLATHPLAGYGGGAKIVTPGVSGRETIHYNHSLISDPNARIGVTDGNPVREDMEEIAKVAGLDFIVNLILNEKRQVLRAFAGDFVKAHREAVKAYEGLYGVRPQEPSDIVVLGACPRDATFGHATFSLYSAVPMVKEGGTIILVAPCLDGPGSRLERLGYKELASIDPSELMEMIRSGEVEASGGAFDYCYAKILRRNEVVLVSDSFTRHEAEELGVGYASTIEEGLEEAFKKHGRDATVTVIPQGGMAVPLSQA